MKLVSGILKGRRLKQPRGSGLRPTSSKVREALFAILGERVSQSRVLDLYAGTGALGLEALSRGAQHVVFIDHAPSSLHVLRENILQCAAQEKSSVIGQEVKRFLRNRSLENPSNQFDLIFVDPPYHTGEVESALNLLGSLSILCPTGRVVLEHFSKHALPPLSGNLEQYRQVRYGDTTLSFYAPKLSLQGLSCA